METGKQTPGGAGSPGKGTYGKIPLGGLLSLGSPPLAPKLGHSAGTAGGGRSSSWPVCNRLLPNPQHAKGSVATLKPLLARACLRNLCKLKILFKIVEN